MLGKTFNIKNTVVDWNKWKGTPFSYKDNIIKGSIFLKSTYKFNSVVIENTISFL